MKHPSKIGGFLARYVRKGIQYDRAKDHCQGNTLLALEAEQKRKERVLVPDGNGGMIIKEKRS